MSLGNNVTDVVMRNLFASEKPDVKEVVPIFSCIKSTCLRSSL